MPHWPGSTGLSDDELQEVRKAHPTGEYADLIVQSLAHSASLCKAGKACGVLMPPSFPLHPVASPAVEHFLLDCIHAGGPAALGQATMQVTGAKLHYK